MKKAKASNLPAVTQPHRAAEIKTKSVRETFRTLAEWTADGGIEERLLLGGDRCVFLETSADSELRRISVAEAHQWWREKQLLNEKTGHLIWGDEIDELHNLVSDVLFKMGREYMRLELL